ncbi:hypothetical protein JAAARDRAFT_62000 [Jaapia argillacea MUCL 33604]|uniref:Uncharacterized protein n=1 Tax=Jaapia argillacea MUCL 33604 TaxID=933084 RepID=A0A067PBB2_9AGAM|nr:hypothetical protein JAAARDRAFT_62000 [Jaapia argillacea MUCL 33604]
MPNPSLPPELVFRVVAEVITEALVDFIVSYNPSHDQFPSKSIGPLLQVSHDSRESALYYLTAGLSIERDADGSLNHNIWSSVKEVRDVYLMSSATSPSAVVLAYHESHAEELQGKPLALFFFMLGLARCARKTCPLVFRSDKDPDDLLVPYLDILIGNPEVPPPSEWGWVAKDWMLPALSEEAKACETVVHFAAIAEILTRGCEIWENFSAETDSGQLGEVISSLFLCLIALDTLSGNGNGYWLPWRHDRPLGARCAE